MNIANKTLLITGANRGIGHALVDEALRREVKRVYAGTRGAPLTAGGRVTWLTLDVTDASQIERAAAEIETLDILINNAGIALYDDLSNPATLEQQFAVNVLGPARVTQAFLPQLRRAHGAIVNHVSLVGLAPLPLIPGYSLTKAALLNLTQSQRALLARDGVSAHAVILGPVDTDMNRGLEIPKASPASAAQAIFDGLENGEEEIFPDPASRAIVEGWRSGVAKALERQFAAFVPQSKAAA